MRELTSDAIARLACTALERTCFIEASACARAPEAKAPLTHFAKIGYHGAEEGFVVLAATEAFIRQLASSVMGAHVADIYLATIGDDALRELANVLAGSIVGELGGEQCRFQIGLPTTCDRSSLPTCDAIVATIGLEGERLEVHWARGRSAQAA